MSEQLSLKNIGLRFLNRIANPVFENKAIGAFLLSGFSFLYFSQPLNVTGKVNLDLGFLKADLSAGNDPNWYLFFLGLAFIIYGGFALYKLKLSPPISRRGEIGELLLSIEQNRSQLRNVQIQQFFLDLFKIKAPVPVIEFILRADDPSGMIYDYRYAGHFVSMSQNRFVPRDAKIDHERRNLLLGWLYYVVSSISLLSAALPLAPFFDTDTKRELATLGFPIAIAFGLIAALILNSIRAHAAALRLLASPAGESPEKRKDKETITGLLQEIHTPTFDDFIHYGKLHFLYGDVIHYWEGFSARMAASNFHLYDEQLRDIVFALHASWGRCFIYSQYFSDTNNIKIQKFNGRHAVYQDEEAKRAHEGFAEAINQTDKNIRNLIALVRKVFPDIDIDATNTAALNDYRKYQITTT